MTSDPLALTVFCLVILATFLVAMKGRKDSSEELESDISKQGLNRWLIGLSAGATANSGFVVTGAVGLGYSFGIYWLLLPLGWLLGDLLFWKFFPYRINEFAAEAKSSTLADLLRHGLKVGRFHPLVVLSTFIVVLCLSGYTMAQWVAGQKFLSGAFGLQGHWTLILFAGIIVAYSSLGRFRGSVYVDSFQAITRVLGTTIAFVAICVVAMRNPASFWSNLEGVDAGFFSIFGSSTIAGTLGFILGYAAAAVGFGLGQPQVTSRYIAGENPDETLAAKWIYIGYLQFTWATMTLFGVLLRGVLPELADPERGLTVFVSTYLPSILVGIIVADIFGAIASTANSLLVAMAQAAMDLFPGSKRLQVWHLIFGLGIATMVVAVLLADTTSVFDLAFTSVSLMAAGLAPAVAIKVMRFEHTAWSLTVSLVAGITAALIWKMSHLSTIINESFIGILTGLLLNFCCSKYFSTLSFHLKVKEHVNDGNRSNSA